MPRNPTGDTLRAGVGSLGLQRTAETRGSPAIVPQDSPASSKEAQQRPRQLSPPLRTLLFPISTAAARRALSVVARACPVKPRVLPPPPRLNPAISTPRGPAVNTTARGKIGGARARLLQRHPEFNAHARTRSASLLLCHRFLLSCAVALSALHTRLVLLLQFHEGYAISARCASRGSGTALPINRSREKRNAT
ncbi:hypothetical protein MTO96_004243 [Rhipicephalus appendiculatus]